MKLKQRIFGSKTKKRFILPRIIIKYFLKKKKQKQNETNKKLTLNKLSLTYYQVQTARNAEIKVPNQC